MPAPFTPCEVPKISNKKVTPIPMSQNITPIINGAIVFPEHTTSFSSFSGKIFGCTPKTDATHSYREASVSSVLFIPYSRLFRVSLIALMKSRLLRITGCSQVEIRDRLLVILPSSMVLMQACSSLSAKLHSSGI